MELAVANKIDIFSISFSDWSFSFILNIWVVIIIAFIVAVVCLFRWINGGFSFKHYEIDQAEIGIGREKLRFKPNLSDKQVAYSIWVELSTRKIGLPIDLEHDVIAEIYSSWYDFFGVTRELIKSVPVGKLKNDSTRKIINLSINVLNDGIRPHLTKWQARFRHWYEIELEKAEGPLIDPQEIQRKFPKYDELKADIEKVNSNLMNYRKKMHELVLSD